MLRAGQFAAPHRIILLLSLLAGAGINSLAQTPVIVTVAGGAQEGSGGDGEHATAAQLRSPCCVAVDSQGNLFISDAGNHRIRKVSPAGIISTVAGTGEKGSQGDGGAAVAAQLLSPGCMAVDSAANLYFADTDNHRIRKVTPEGIISTVAGAGKSGDSGDGGAAASALLSYPGDVAIDSAGNLYIADTGNHRIRKVSREGTISTVAGAGKQGYGGDGGPAVSALLSYPSRIAVDSLGNLYIADTGNHRIRKVSREGTISTVAGTGKQGYGGDAGPAISALLNNPFGLTVDSAGNLYIADTGNSRIRKVSREGTISTVAGADPRGYGGDRQASATAQLDSPFGVVVNAAGDLFIADTGNHRIRMVADPQRAFCTIACTVSAPPSASAGEQVSFSAAASAQGCSGAISFNWAFSSGLRETGPTVTVTFPNPGSFSWTMTAWLGFAACSTSGVIHVTAPEAARRLRIRAWDELRTPPTVTAFPGQTLYWHYILETEAGAAVSADRVSVAISTSGFDPLPDAFTFQMEEPGHLVVAAEVDKLNLPPSGTECSFAFRLGPGAVRLDGEAYELAEAPPAVSLSLGDPSIVEGWEIFSRPLPGDASCVDACGQSDGASLNASVVRFAGALPGNVGLRLEQERHGLAQAGSGLRLTRRFPLPQGVRLRAPPLEFQPRATTEAAAVGASATGVQSLSYTGNSPKEARLLHAAFLLESLALAGAPLPPVAGPVLAATLDSLNATPELISAARTRSMAGTAVTAGNSDPAPTSGFGAVTQVFEQQVGALRDPPSRAWNYLSRIRWAGREAFGGPTVALPNGMQALEYSQELRLSPGLEPLAFEIALESAEAHGAPSSLHTRTVRYRYRKPEVLAALQAAFPTVTSLWRQAKLAVQRALPSLSQSTPITPPGQVSEQTRQINDLARQSAHGPAYEVTTEEVSLHTRAAEVGVNLVFPASGRNVELTFPLLALRERKLTEASRSVAFQGREWKLSQWSGSLDEAQTPELPELLRNEVFSGLGAWIEQAWRRRVAEISALAPPGGLNILEIRDRLTQKLVAALSVPAEYAGLTIRILSYSPDRPEAVGPRAPTAGAQWRYTSSRIAGKLSPPSSYLVAAGNVVELAVLPEGGADQAPLSAFQPPLRAEFVLNPARLVRSGLDDKNLAGAGLYRYDSATYSWSATPSILAPDGRSLRAELTQPGIYMPGVEIAVDPGDSDQDGLPDAQEDLNGNGVLDAEETSPYLWDTDGDGVSDGEERRLGADPVRASSCPNRPPVLAFVGNHTVRVGDTLELGLVAWDADDQPLTFYASPLPPDAELEASTGRLRWKPSAAGEYRVELSVSDGVLSDAENILLVAEAPD